MLNKLIMLSNSKIIVWIIVISLLTKIIVIRPIIIIFFHNPAALICVTGEKQCFLWARGSGARCCRRLSTPQTGEGPSYRQVSAPCQTPHRTSQLPKQTCVEHHKPSEIAETSPRRPRDYVVLTLTLIPSLKKQLVCEAFLTLWVAAAYHIDNYLPQNEGKRPNKITMLRFMFPLCSKPLSDFILFSVYYRDQSLVSWKEHIG